MTHHRKIEAGSNFIPIANTGACAKCRLNKFTKLTQDLLKPCKTLHVIKPFVHF